jgi:DNA-binding response OmpR family regulator
VAHQQWEILLHSSNVLLVEDDAQTRRAIRKILSHEGFVICSSNTLAYASTLLSWADIMVLDLMLPDGNGVDLLRDARAGGLEIKVAVVTGVDDQEVLAEVARLQPDRLFKKPLDVAEFIAWLRHVSTPPSPFPSELLAC